MIAAVVDFALGFFVGFVVATDTKELGKAIFYVAVCSSVFGASTSACRFLGDVDATNQCAVHRLTAGLPGVALFLISWGGFLFALALGLASKSWVLGRDLKSAWPCATRFTLLNALGLSINASHSAGQRNAVSRASPLLVYDNELATLSPPSSWGSRGGPPAVFPSGARVPHGSCRS